MALTVDNRNMFSNIDEINSDRSTWNLKAKIIRLWQVSDFNRPNVPFSVEMVLMDSDGAKIHATIKKTLIYKFKHDLIEGKVYSFENLGVASNNGGYRTTHHPYKLNFQFGSFVQRLSNCDIVKSPFTFVPIAEVVGGLYDTDFLVDVIGFLTEIGQEREITNQNGSTTKLNVISLEADGHKLQCTLFGPYVDELNTFVGAGDLNNAVVIVQLAKAKTFQDKIHIQNCMNCSVLLFNPNCEESQSFRARCVGSDENPSPLTFTQLSNEPTVTPLDEFLYNTPKATLQDLKDATKESSHVVSATVKRILNPDSYWYTSCFCSKGVIPDSRLWFCEKCNRHVPKVVPRFCVKLRVMDHTDSATLVVFDKEASGIFNMSCADMLQLGDADNDGEGIVPPRIDDSLVNQTWLFKVETKPSQNPRFEQSFRVRKICTDDGIIKQFKDKWDSEDAVRTKKRNEGGSLSTLLDKGKDVYVGGTSNVLSQECQNFSGDSEKGKGLIVDGTPVEVSQDLMLKFSESVVNLDDDSVNTSFSVKSMTYGNKQLTYVAAVNPTTSALAVKPNTSVIDVNEMTSVDAVKATTSVVFTQQSASAVNPLNSASGEDVSVKSSASGRPCGQRKKSFAKRVSPQHEDQDVEDDNAPIKLLKRAVKIEKIP
ncbi:replication protein A 70 kDa DNA-binding subunit A-like [Trifolium pratense]|uniref:replication protein A 70 kDa DNA-binding subunit A-like n=1 Tax=Trifolium pratense TaxID=57577 RepID=UPI001E694A10|nr:replication protein A 70 kDa DNA-binding subunit A-like [Trifolium pratense]